MREATAELLRCPRCRRDRTLDLDAATSDDREIRDGLLRCRECGHEAALRDGIADLLHEPPAFVTREAAGLERYAEQVMRCERGWGAGYITSLPYVQNGYWYTQAATMEHLLRVVDFQPGQRLLDVGANTCWVAHTLAARGLDVIALDILSDDLQGLGSAEHWLAHDGVFFERTLGTMFDLPIAAGSLDYVFCCQVLHHNDRAHLRQTFEEASRALKPGGLLIVANETMRFPLDLNLRPGARHPNEDVSAFEGNEHAYFYGQYAHAARRAGFGWELLEPMYHPFFRDEPYTLTPAVRDREAVRMVALNMLRKRASWRRRYRDWLTMVRGTVQLTALCRKPTAPRADAPPRRAAGPGRARHGTVGTGPARSAAT